MKRLITLGLALIIISLPVSVLAISDQQLTQQPSTQAGSDDDECYSSGNSQSDGCLTKSKAEKIKGQCTSLQSKTNQIANRIQTLETSRNNLFDNITQVLSNLITRLENNGIDTTELEANVQEITDSVNETKQYWTSYQTSLQNMAASKCDSDPESFHNELKNSRTAANQVKAKIKEIKALIQSDIKSDLAKIKQQIQNQSNDND